MAKEQANAAPLEPPPEVATYWKYRRRTGGTVLVVLVALALLIVFRRPGAWGDGVIAGIVHDAALALTFGGTLMIYLFRGRMAEQRGFVLGKHGKAPTAWPAPKRAPKALPAHKKAM